MDQFAGETAVLQATDGGQILVKLNGVTTSLNQQDGDLID